MEFLRLFLRLHLAGKPVVASPNVGCFLGLKDSSFKGGLNVTKKHNWVSYAFHAAEVKSSVLKSSLLEAFV